MGAAVCGEVAAVQIKKCLIGKSQINTDSLTNIIITTWWYDDIIIVVTREYS